MENWWKIGWKICPAPGRIYLLTPPHVFSPERDNLLTYPPDHIRHRLTQVEKKRNAGTHARARAFSELGMADAAGVAAVLQPPRRAPVAQERFKWTPKQSLSYLATFFVATWLGAFLITFLLVQVLLRMS